MSQKAAVFDRRRGGVLLHITSLPSGTIGADAFHFIDFLHDAKMTIWQMLPLGPTHGDGSPYQCLSAHAANEHLICQETIKAQSWAYLSDQQGDIASLIETAYVQFEANATSEQKRNFSTFCEQQAYWLDDYVLFCIIREQYGSRAWFDWPEPLRDRHVGSLAAFRKIHAHRLIVKRFEQFQFFEQWQALKSYANDKEVLLFGDMPIFVAHDSADVWANRDLFTLDSRGHATRVAGVPPDYFSETGQRWGNPLYEWQRHQQQDFVWWQQRMQTQLVMFDLIRIDHFRGFEACWEIPAECETAIDGQWVAAPGNALFDKLTSLWGALPLVAEDLGIITAEVTALREKYAMPGMKILQFAFGGGADNPYLPHHHQQDSVAYTGTHDNNTTVGWYNELDEGTKAHLSSYLGGDNEGMPWLLNRVAMSSVAQMAIIPMQDVLGLDSQHRMNVPGTTEGNWSWSFEWHQLESHHVHQLRYLNDLYGRSEP